MAAVAQAGTLLDQCRPCHLQVFEHKQGVRSGRIRFQPQGSPHPGQDACIDGIGLGSGSARFGKATGLQRIDLDQRQLARQRRLKGPVLGPVGSKTMRATGVWPSQRIKARKPRGAFSNGRAAWSSSRKTSRWVFEMSMPMVCSVNFAMSYACHG